MDKVGEIFMVFIVTILIVVGMFIGMIVKHEKEHKKEIRETNANKNSIRQHNKSCDDVVATGRRQTTTPTTSTKT
jgi:hypothetical protein